MVPPAGAGPDADNAIDFALKAVAALVPPPCAARSGDHTGGDVDVGADAHPVALVPWDMG